MKYLRYAFLAVVLLVCVTLALANRAPVTLALWPDTVTAFLGFGYSMTLPLFVIVGGAAGIGLVLGLIWEWLREHGNRKEVTKLRRENSQLRAEVPNVPAPDAPRSKPRDQVLAILEDSDGPR